MMKTIIEAIRRSVAVVERFIEAMRPLVIVAERFTEAIWPSIPGVKATIMIEAVERPVVVAIGSPILVRVGTESVEVAVRIIVVPVVRGWISRADTHAIMNTRTAAAHERTYEREQQDPKKPAGFLEAEIHKELVL